MALLAVRDLQTRFFLRRGVMNAVDGISFDLERGETLGLVGESGSGKSMAALSLLRLVPSPGRIIGGSVVFDGIDLLSLSEKEMLGYRGRHISMILQDPLSSLNPVFTVGDQIGEGLVIHDRLRGRSLLDRIVELMRWVGIPAAETRVGDYPHQFSGGMRQRVVGAVALACRPHVLIADEPTTSLDVTIQMQYLNLLKSIQQREQLAMLFITHDLGVVAKMCDTVAVMYAGKIVERGSVRDIFDRPSHPYTKALVNSVPKAGQKRERLASIEGQPPALLNLPPGCSFLPRCSESFAACLSDEFPPEKAVGENHCT